MTRLARLLLRACETADLSSVQAIYAEHVLTGLASFEVVPPDLREITRRFEAVRGAGLPYLLAESEGRVLGYAYAGPYRTRPAYRYTLEDSIYVAPAASGRGVGRALLTRLLADCEALGYRQMVAVIGDSANQPSIALHRALGFREVGLFQSVGFKFGRWVDSVLMQRPLGPGDGTLPPEEV